MKTELSDDVLAMLETLKGYFADERAVSERYAAAVARLRAEIAGVGRPMVALLDWDSPVAGEVSIRLDLLEDGTAELGPEMDTAFEASLAQALASIGALVLTTDAPLQVVGSKVRSEMRGYELAHGTWRPDPNPTRNEVAGKRH